MNPPSENLERLISRFLDDEATPAEQRQLAAAIRNDPQAETLFEELSALDREAGAAIRHHLGHNTRFPTTRRNTWKRVGRLTTLAAAAGLALLVWLRPNPHTTPHKSPQHATFTNNTSWFEPVPRGDTLASQPAGAEIPQIRVRDLDQQWIVIPGQQPGEYFLIEMNKVKTRVIRVHEDL